MWEYYITDGSIALDGSYVGRGYSGHWSAVNNPSKVSEAGRGPIPPGDWLAQRAPWSRKGPQVLSLTPMVGTETYRRSGFMIHGDNKRNDRSASTGCIVLSRDIRDKIARDTPCVIRVHPGTFVQS